nr:hypothetical protein [Tanacetum cinerariifolium]
IGNKENKDTIPKKEKITDDIYNWITAKYEEPNETWTDDRFKLVADDVFKTFYDKLDSEQDDSDDSNDEEFSSSSAELVTCILVSTKKSFSDEVEDDTNEEAKDDKDDLDDETWSPKTIRTTSKSIISLNKKGETSSFSPSTKKKLVNR